MLSGCASSTLHEYTIVQELFVDQANSTTTSHDPHDHLDDLPYISLMRTWSHPMHGLDYRGFAVAAQLRNNFLRFQGEIAKANPDYVGQPKTAIDVSGIPIAEIERWEKETDMFVLPSASISLFRFDRCRGERTRMSLVRGAWYIGGGYEFHLNLRQQAYAFEQERVSIPTNLSSTDDPVALTGMFLDIFFLHIDAWLIVRPLDPFQNPRLNLGFGIVL